MFHRNTDTLVIKCLDTECNASIFFTVDHCNFVITEHNEDT